MRFLSLFSGIEAASEAWLPLGWECAGVAEIDPFACAVLAHRHPHVPNLGDITKITEMQIAALGHVDLIVFGSPCQDLSIAGKQKGLSGDRSGLFYPAVNIISWARLWCGARFALWENVPGAFSSNQGRDFAAVVGALAGLDDVGVPPKGWGTEGCAVGSEAMVEWATLDAQWFGVAQRRRRIFALADFGDWAGRPPVLLEPEGVRGDSAPRREAGQNAASSLASCTTGGGFTDTAPTLDCRCKNGPVQNQVGCGVIQPVRGPVTQAFGGNNQSGPIDVATARNACASASGRLDFETETFLVTAHMDVMPTLRSGGGSSASHGAVSGDSKDEYVVPVVCATGCVTHTLTAEGFDTSEDGSGRGTPVIAFHANAQADQLPSETRDTSVSDPLTCSQSAAVALAYKVRRLTPVECERLQGFPDGHTQIPWRNKPAGQCPDGPRYKALGNSMAVPVMRWIGQKIDVALLFQE